MSCMTATLFTLETALAETQTPPGLGISGVGEVVKMRKSSKFSQKDDQKRPKLSSGKDS